MFRRTKYATLRPFGRRGNLTSVRDPKELLILAARESRKASFRSLDRSEEPLEQPHELGVEQEGLVRAV